MDNVDEGCGDSSELLPTKTDLRTVNPQKWITKIKKYILWI